jgi:nucleotide-binding universal stress UspA family protein
MTETRAAEPQEGQPVAQPDRLFADILCAVDGTRRSFAAVEQAAALAGPQGHLTLLAVTAVRGAGAYRSAAISTPRAERILVRAARIAQKADVPFTSVLDPAGPPPQVILERAAEHDLLALGAPASSWLGGKFVDGVAVAALGSFTTPLLLSRSVPTGEHRFAQRILVASDGLDGSDQLVDLVGRLALVHGASVILLHATGVESRARPHRIQAQARSLEDALDGACEVRIEVGSAAEAIVQVGKDAEASLVVMGSRRLEGLKALGSVSRRVVHEAHCSVMLMPPERLQG